MAKRPVDARLHLLIFEAGGLIVWSSVVSDVETVALIVVFLVLSLIIVRLIGGDADTPVVARGTRHKAEPPPALARTAPVTAAETVAQTTPGQTPDEAAVTVVSKAAAPPVEAARVKIDLPPPAPVRSAPMPTAPPVAQAPVQPAPQPQEAAPAPIIAKAPAAAPAAAASSAPVAQKTESAPVSSPAVAAAATPVRPDAKATIQPGASTVAAPAPSWTPPSHNLSPDEQAIVSRYLRPDLKSTLYRAPPPGAVPAPVAVVTAAPVVELAPIAAKPAVPYISTSGPSPVLSPRVGATLPPGYHPPVPPAMPTQFAASTGFAPLGVLPDANATLPRAVGAAAPFTATKVEPAEAEPGPTPLPLSPAGYAPPNATNAPATASASDAGAETPSPRAARAATLPPSTAVESTTPPAATGAVPASTASEPVLLSTAKRGTRVIGVSNDDLEPIDLSPPPAPRPQTPSIWSSSYPKPSVAYTMPLGIDAILPAAGVRAERVPVRAETVLVRRGSEANGGASYTASPAATSARASLDKSAVAPSVRYTLPPGALGDE